MKFPPGCSREDINSIHSYGLEVYAPRLPEYCLENFKQRVYDQYKLPPRVLPANPALLDGQGTDAGGAATMPPPSHTVVEARVDGPFGNGLGLPPPPPVPIAAIAAEPPRQVPPPACAFQAMPTQPAPVSTMPPMPTPMHQSAQTVLPSYPVPPSFPPSDPAITAYPTGPNPYQQRRDQQQ